MLLDTPPAPVTFLKSETLNPATFLPDEQEGPPIHDCLETVSTLTGVRVDLKDQLLDPVDTATDGSSYVWEGVRYMGTAVLTPSAVIWAQAL